MPRNTSKRTSSDEEHKVGRRPSRSFMTGRSLLFYIVVFEIVIVFISVTSLLFVYAYNSRIPQSASNPDVTITPPPPAEAPTKTIIQKAPPPPPPPQVPANNRFSAKTK